MKQFHQCMYIILTPRRVASFLKASLSVSTHTIGTALSTVVNRFRFDSRGRSQSRLTWHQHWTKTYSRGSRGSHALYLELHECPALTVRLRSRDSNPNHAPSILVTTPRRWPFFLDLQFQVGSEPPGARKTLRKNPLVLAGIEPGPPDQQSVTLPTVPPRSFNYISVELRF